MSIEPTEARQFKHATRKLIKAVGGLKVAAGHLDKSVTVVGRWEEDTPRFVNVADLRELEAIAPRPFVTELLCRFAGGVFVPNIDCAAEEGSPAWLVMQLSKELGDVSGEIAQALANDGGIDRDEAGAALEQLNELEAMSRRLRALLTRLASAEREGVAHGAPFD